MKNLKFMLFGIITMLVLNLNVNALAVSDSDALYNCLKGTDSVCTLDKDITATKVLEIVGEKILDLNGKTLTLAGVTDVGNGANLTVTGNGKVFSSGNITTYLFRVKPTGSLTIENGTYLNEHSSGGVIRVLGDNLGTDTKSKLDVKSDALLQGTYGISIYGFNYDNHNSELGKKGQYAEGIEVSFAGKLDTKSIGITVNGNVEYAEKEYPIINILDGASIESSMSLYIAGYSKWNIGAATLTSIGTGIGIKAGQVYVDGAKVTATGENNPNPEKWGNGMNSSGSAIQIETNKGYADHIVLNIKSGEFISENGYSFLEYLGETNIVG